MYSRLAGYVFWQVAFVLVLVQIDLIHFEHTKCISSTVGRRGTNQAQSSPDLEWYLDVLVKHTTEIPPLAALVEGVLLR